jgi:adenine phosphoribosyltransferase
MEDLRRIIRDVPDFPQKGVVFKDITPLLAHPESFRKAIDLMAEPLRGRDFELLVGI